MFDIIWVQLNHSRINTKFEKKSNLFPRFRYLGFSSLGEFRFGFYYIIFLSYLNNFQNVLHIFEFILKTSGFFKDKRRRLIANM
jgi:hypothetical protein